MLLGYIILEVTVEFTDQSLEKIQKRKRKKDGISK
jgi:hypothetical protein